MNTLIKKFTSFLFTLCILLLTQNSYAKVSSRYDINKQTGRYYIAGFCSDDIKQTTVFYNGKAHDVAISISFCALQFSDESAKNTIVEHGLIVSIRSDVEIAADYRSFKVSDYSSKYDYELVKFDEITTSKEKADVVTTHFVALPPKFIESYSEDVSNFMIFAISIADATISLGDDKAEAEEIKLISSLTPVPLLE